MLCGVITQSCNATSQYYFVILSRLYYNCNITPPLQNKLILKLWLVLSLFTLPLLLYLWLSLYYYQQVVIISSLQEFIFLSILQLVLQVLRLSYLVFIYFLVELLQHQGAIAQHRHRVVLWVIILPLLLDLIAQLALYLLDC